MADRMGVPLAPFERGSETFDAAMQKATGWIQRSKLVPGSVRANPRRAIVSLAESIVARNAARPITIPLKLWLTWNIVSRRPHI